MISTHQAVAQYCTDNTHWPSESASIDFTPIVMNPVVSSDGTTDADGPISTSGAMINNAKYVKLGYNVIARSGWKDNGAVLGQAIEERASHCSSSTTLPL